MMISQGPQGDRLLASRPSLFSGAGRGPDESLRHAWQKHVQDRIMHLAPITMLEEKRV